MGDTESGMERVVPAARSPYVGKRLLDVVVGLVLSVLTLPIVLVRSVISAAGSGVRPASSRSGWA